MGSRNYFSWRWMRLKTSLSEELMVKMVVWTKEMVSRKNSHQRGKWRREEGVEENAFCGIFWRYLF